MKNIQMKNYHLREIKLSVEYFKVSYKRFSVAVELYHFVIRRAL